MPRYHPCNQIASLALIQELRQRHPMELKAWQKDAGLWVIGHGHTRVVSYGQRISEHQAESLLRNDICWCESLLREIRPEPMSPGDWDAAVSLIWDAGGVPRLPDFLVDQIRTGDIATADLEPENMSLISRWNAATGRRARLWEIDRINQG